MDGAADEQPDLTGHAAKADRAFRWVSLVAGMAVLIVLCLIVYTMLSRTGPVFRKMGFRFFTEQIGRAHV